MDTYISSLIYSYHFTGPINKPHFRKVLFNVFSRCLSSRRVSCCRLTRSWHLDKADNNELVFCLSQLGAYHFNHCESACHKALTSLSIMVLTGRPHLSETGKCKAGAPSYGLLLDAKVERIAYELQIGPENRFAQPHVFANDLTNTVATWKQAYIQSNKTLVDQVRLCHFLFFNPHSRAEQNSRQETITRRSKNGPGRVR